MANERQQGGNPQQGTQLAKAQATVIDLLRKNKGEYLRVMPVHLNPERMLRLAETSIRRSPNLALCTPMSVLVSVMQAASLGLEIDVLGEAWLVPMKEKGVPVAQLWPGYKGYVKLAHQGGHVAGFQTGEVREGDEFDYGLGSDPFVKHKPSLDPAVEAKDPFLFYASAKLKSGFSQVALISRMKAELIKSRSPGARSGASPWHSHFNAMALKSAVRAVVKLVPMSPQLAKVEEYENRRDAGEDVTAMFPELEGAMALEAEGRTIPEGEKSTAGSVAEKLGVDPKAGKPIGPDDPDYIPFDTGGTPPEPGSNG